MQFNHRKELTMKSLAQSSYIRLTTFVFTAASIAAITGSGRWG
jgi:hypothetical protein